MLRRFRATLLVIRRHPFLLFGTYLVFVLPIYAAAILTEIRDEPPGLLAITFVLGLILTPLGMGAIARAVVERCDEAEVRLRDVVSDALAKRHSLVWLLFEQIVVIGAAVLLAIFVMFYLWLPLNAGLLFLLVVVIGSAYVALRWSFGFAVVMYERERGWQALRKSWHRTSGMALSLMCGLIPILLVAPIQFLVSFLSGMYLEPTGMARAPALFFGFMVLSALGHWFFWVSVAVHYADSLFSERLLRDSIRSNIEERRLRQEMPALNEEGA